MKNIIIIISLILFYLSFYMVKKRKSSFNTTPYDVAYELGTHFLNNFDYTSVPGASVMFDIDDTLLYVNKNGSLTPIKPIIKLLKECNKRGIIVIIITARDSVYSIETMKDLANNDIYPMHIGKEHDEMYYNYLYLRKNNQDNLEHFKTKIKENYASNGLNIIMSLGDNIIDVEGPYSGYGIKLPNKTDDRLFHLNNDRKLEEIVY